MYAVVLVVLMLGVIAEGLVRYERARQGVDRIVCARLACYAGQGAGSSLVQKPQ